MTQWLVMAYPVKNALRIGSGFGAILKAQLVIRPHVDGFPGALATSARLLPASAELSDNDSTLFFFNFDSLSRRFQDVTLLF